MDRVGVECTIAANGTVRVRRVHMAGRWRGVEQGRQWLADDGRHVLIRASGGQVRELILRPETLTWELAPARRETAVV